MAVSYLPAILLRLITSFLSSAVSAPICDNGKSILALCTMPGAPFSSRKLTSASPVSSCVIASSVLNAGFVRKVSAATLTAFWSRGVYALSACCTRLPNCPSMLSGMSVGSCEMKYMPTPLLRISRITCSILSVNAFGVSSKSMCASSKKKMSFGISWSPTSGSVEYSSEIIHSRKVLYSFGCIISLSAASTLITPFPPSVAKRSRMSNEGSPKNWLAPWFSS